MAVSLIECVNNFRRFTGLEWGMVLECVTKRPAEMLGEERKGKLDVGCDADLVILGGGEGEEGLKVEGVWKFGVEVV